MLGETMKINKKLIFEKFKSIHMIMLMSFSGLVLLTVGIFAVFSISYTKENIIKNSTEYSSQLVEQASGSIDYYIDYMENISELMVQNADVDQYLFGNSNDTVYQRLSNNIYRFFMEQTDIYNVVLLAENGRYLINGGRDEINKFAQLDFKEWYINAMNSCEDYYLSSSHVQNIVKGKYNWVVTLSKKLGNDKNGQEGLLFIDLNYDVISNICESIKLGNRGYIYILDSNGKIVYHPQQQLLLSGLKTEVIEDVLKLDNKVFKYKSNEEYKIYTPFYSENTKWTIVGVSYENELLKGEKGIKNVYSILAIIIVIFAILGAFIFSNKITKPIKQLKLEMEKVQDDKFVIEDTLNSIKGGTEIQSLRRSYKHMMIRIEELMKKIIDEQNEKRNSEMKALQSQINPHFLYNTLDSIIWMIEINDNDGAILMTSALARLFRQAIGNSNVYVPIAQEIDYTKNYLIIQRMRYRDKVEFEFDIQDEVLEGKVIKLVLQPLVENALYHGLKYKKEQGLIRIKGYKVDNDIMLQVIDNGIGISKEELDKILEEDSRKSGSGVGLANIQNRLQLIYGKEYGLTIESLEGISTTVTIHIPFQKTEEKV